MVKSKLNKTISFVNCPTIDQIVSLARQEDILTDTIENTIQKIREKKISPNSLPRLGGLRDQVKRIILRECSTLEDLLSYLKYFNGLYTVNGKYYSPKQIEKSIELVKTHGIKALDRVPRGLGLRTKIQKLLIHL